MPITQKRTKMHCHLQRRKCKENAQTKNNMAQSKRIDLKDSKWAVVKLDHRFSRKWMKYKKGE